MKGLRRERYEMMGQDGLESSLDLCLPSRPSSEEPRGRRARGARGEREVDRVKGSRSHRRHPLLAQPWRGSAVTQPAICRPGQVGPLSQSVPPEASPALIHPK